MVGLVLVTAAVEEHAGRVEYRQADADAVLGRWLGPAFTAAGGGLVAGATGSGKSSIYMVLPKYQFIFNTAYELPYGITFGANYLFRDGYSEPFYRSRVATGDVLSGIMR